MAFEVIIKNELEERPLDSEEGNLSKPATGVAIKVEPPGYQEGGTLSFPHLLTSEIDIKEEPLEPDLAVNHAPNTATDIVVPTDLPSLKVDAASVSTEVAAPIGDEGAVLSQSDPRFFICQFCTKVFKRKDLCDKHKRIHTGERPFKCNQCPLKFKQEPHLKEHMMTHTGERPFQCKFCPKAFIKKGAMKYHERIHTGEKPFQCSHCDYRCTQKTNLSKHQKKCKIIIEALKL